MNVLVTGANGQLGMELRALAAGSGDHYVFTGLHEAPGLETILLDISNRSALDLICESEKINVIINCAAYNDVNRAEDDYPMADLINHQGAENLAAAALKAKAVLIHISTDYVFDGMARSPYSEQAAVAPLGVYGATKAAGERGIIGSGCKYFIFRTQWLYSAYRKNFVKTLVSRLKETGKANVVIDQIGCPTYAGDLAAFLVKLISSRKIKKNFGLYNFSDEGTASWYDFACSIQRHSGLEGSISPCLAKDFIQKAQRPHYSVLDKTLVKKTFGIKIPHWEDSLQKFFAQQTIK